ncbi:MAG: SRPBCC domain-containing protein [Phycisphaeraceae bacterium]|nr:SRPBCC domain-containing protein [Phycisphaerales bacterium]MCB9841945.1 SRPBCC domain-containing protein [Phycisphaeraceae bacterium]
MTTTGKQRAPIETTMTIHAPVDAVWEALCTGEGLASWFPLEARVKPGVGGTVFTSWRNEFVFDMPIMAWEPNKHVRWQWGAHEGDAPAPSVVDFYLESKGGDTILRMVHHGFSADADWDEMYNGTVRGWDFELNSLKTYLDYHRGQPRHVAHVRSPIKSLAYAEAFERLLAPGALVSQGSFKGLTVGDRFDVTLTGGQRLRGRVRAHQPDQYLCFEIDNLDQAIMRIDIESCDPGKGPLVWLWLSAWGNYAKEAEALNKAWLGVMNKCFGEALPIGAEYAG